MREKSPQRAEYEAAELSMRIAGALEILFDYGGVEGVHHKAWVIDQVVRQLTNFDYDTWRENYENDGEFWWDEGVPP